MVHVRLRALSPLSRRALRYRDGVFFVLRDVSAISSRRSLERYPSKWRMLHKKRHPDAEASRCRECDCLMKRDGISRSPSSCER